MAETIIKNLQKYRVLTPSGYSDFSAIRKIEKTGVATIEFENGIKLDTSLSHLIKVKDAGFVSAENISVGDEVVAVDGLRKVKSVSIDRQKKTVLYDLLDVELGNEYFTNGVLSHNCQFLSSDPLLIKSMVLAGMKGRKPINEDRGFTFWKPFDESKTYLIGVDVATGVRNDFSTIEIFEYPSLEQVGEFRSNKVSLPQFFKRIKWILGHLASITKEVYWTYESNGPGAAIGAMYLNEDDFPEVTLISDNNRYGMVTSGKNKVRDCLELKRLIEKARGGMLINSEMLIFELKNYVASGASYEAKQGATDDLISALLMIIRMMKKMSEYEPEMFNTLYREDDDEYDEYGGEDFEGSDEPMPCVF